MCIRDRTILDKPLRYDAGVYPRTRKGSDEEILRRVGEKEKQLVETDSKKINKSFIDILLRIPRNGSDEEIIRKVEENRAQLCRHMKMGNSFIGMSSVGHFFGASN